MTIAIEFVRGNLPPGVEPGQHRLFIVAGVTKEGRETCYPAYYLNAYPLERDECVCASEEVHDAAGGDGCPATGWFYDESNFEYEHCYWAVNGEVIAYAEWPDRLAVHASLQPVT